tara:strand:+ start:731 stop:1285 length:555 start_codon:yes stop_codon:yes gene_type:complete
MPNNKKNKSNRRRLQTGGGAKYCPTTEESSFCDLQIVKHNNLIKSFDKQIDQTQQGVLISMFAKIRFMDDPEQLEIFKNQEQLGNDRLTDLNNWKTHSELMVKLFNCFVKGSKLDREFSVLDHNCKVEIVKKIGDEIKDNIHKVLEGVEVMVQYGSDFYTEGRYNEIAVMFKEEYELWSRVLMI